MPGITTTLNPLLKRMYAQHYLQEADRSERVWRQAFYPTFRHAQLKRWAKTGALKASQDWLEVAAVLPLYEPKFIRWSRI